MRVFYALLLLAGASLVVSGQSGATKPTKQVQAPFTLTISAESVVKAGSQVALKVRLTNTSNRPMNTSSQYIGGVHSGYLYDVRDGAGNLIEKKAHKESDEPIMGSLRLGKLKPSESRDEGTLVSDVYDMSRPGTYTIQLSLPISNDPKDGVVKSNPITVTVNE